jgi:hypothetical protein
MNIKNYIILFGALIALSYSSCKKDDSGSSSTNSTSTTGTTSTTASANDPHTLVYDGVIVPNIVGSCDFSATELTIVGTGVDAKNNVGYQISVDFENPSPASGTYKTTALPTDPLTSTQCHMVLQRTTTAQTLNLIAPANADVVLVKNGSNYTVSFGTIAFKAILGGNGTRKVSCNGFGCE